MEIIHTGLGASSENQADRFYIDILGLEKSEPKALAKKLSQTIFGIDDELLMIRYRGAKIHVEVFVYAAFAPLRNQVSHSCLKVTDIAKMVDKCRQAGISVIEASKDSKIVTFVSDYDGNLFELKE